MVIIAGILPSPQLAIIYEPFRKYSLRKDTVGQNLFHAVDFIPDRQFVKAGTRDAGVFSVFPAVFISTLFIAYQTRGVEFARSLTKPLMMSGMINVPAYAIAVRHLYP